jgi:hypothetical protein
MDDELHSVDSYDPNSCRVLVASSNLFSLMIVKYQSDLETEAGSSIACAYMAK